MPGNNTTALSQAIIGVSHSIDERGSGGKDDP